MNQSGRLQSWIQQQLRTGLPALAGARVAGTIPLPVTLLNDLIAEALAADVDGWGTELDVVYACAPPSG